MKKIIVDVKLKRLIIPIATTQIYEVNMCMQTFSSSSVICKTGGLIVCKFPVDNETNMHNFLH